MATAHQRRATLVAMLAAGLLAIGWLVWREPAPVAEARMPVSVAWQLNPFANSAPTESARQQAWAHWRADEAALRVSEALKQGSLQGTALDGSWGILAGSPAQLQPSLALRQRFDYLLTLHGEVTDAELRHWIAQRASLDVGSERAGQVLALWDNYIALQKHHFANGPRSNDAAAAQRSLAERAQVRRKWLGPQWAQAFYAEQEQALAAFNERRQTGQVGTVAQAPPADGQAQAALLVPSTKALTPAQTSALQAQRTAQFGLEAAERLQQEDVARAQWEERLASASQQVQALGGALELSPLQRLAAQERALTEQFSDSELVRARALLLPAAL